jgi:hypothetical protein
MSHQSNADHATRPRHETSTRLDIRNDGEDDPESRLRMRRRGGRWSTILYLFARSFRSSSKSWDMQFPGWRSGVAGFSLLTSVILLLNISALSWTATHLDDGAYATVAVQSCKNIGKLTSYAQFGINAFSTGLLAGSNYCMQCLSSPTRKEIDAAHAKNSYLNIGILSWRNVISFRKRRICLLLALVLSSVPLLAVYEHLDELNT